MIWLRHLFSSTAVANLTVFCHYMCAICSEFHLLELPWCIVYSTKYSVQKQKRDKLSIKQRQKKTNRKKDKHSNRHTDTQTSRQRSTKILFKNHVCDDSNLGVLFSIPVKIQASSNYLWKARKGFYSILIFDKVLFI